MDTAEFVKRARVKHGDSFSYFPSDYAGFRQPIEIVCRQHGPFVTTPKYHLHSKTGGCKPCLSQAIGNASRLANAQFIERAGRIHGDRYDYSQVDYKGNRTKVTIVCPKHGPFRMTPGRHIQGRGCRKCTYNRLAEDRRLSFWEFVEQVVDVHGAGRYEYELRGHKNQNSKIPIRCPKHGVFSQSIGSHIVGSGCPRCVQSNGEQRVREVLTELDIDFSEQVRFAECRDKRSLPFDFSVPSRRLLIEYDGQQHYEESKYWGGQEKLAETQRHDAIKNEFAATHGYRLLRIPYWEYERIDEIVLDTLVESEQCVQ